MQSDAHLAEGVEAAIVRLVESGRFASRADVLEAGVELLEQREALAKLNATMNRSLADSAAGRTEEIGVVRDRLLERYRDWPRSAA